MPQLNPSPWFMILVFTWSVFTILMLPKIMSHKSPNEINPQNVKTLKTTPWTWQWH